MEKVTLKSGKLLEITLANFRDGKKLLDAVVRELRSAKLDPKQELDVNFIKDSVFGVLCSEEVESALWPCLTKCLYVKQYIKADLFEDVSAREDFLEICYEVAKANLLPFGKNLYAEWSPILGNLQLSQK